MGLKKNHLTQEEKMWQKHLDSIMKETVMPNHSFKKNERVGTLNKVFNSLKSRLGFEGSSRYKGIFIIHSNK